MLIRITQYDDLDERKLMYVYSESNSENTEYFCPDEPDKEKAVRQVEAGFLGFLKNDFFSMPEAAVWVYEENGTWLSALRTCKVRDVHYLEALETRPGSTKKRLRRIAAVSSCGRHEKGRPFPAVRLRQQKEYAVPENS